VSRRRARAATTTSTSSCDLVGGTQLDLFADLAASTPGVPVVHYLTPSMLMLCGVGFLDAARGLGPGSVRPWVFVREGGATCPECLAVDDPEGVVRAQQGR